MKENYFASVKVIDALQDILHQIDYLYWTIPATDRGSSSAGVGFIDDASIINDYLTFAITGNNEAIPACIDISYSEINDFSEEEKEVIDEILDYASFINRNEIIGLVVIDEQYDMPYTLYIPHISEDRLRYNYLPMME